MTQRRRTQEVAGLATTHPVFGAFSATGDLLLVVEADHVETAASRIAQVVVLVSPKAAHPLSINRLDTAPGGVPVFFDAYFGGDEDEDPMRRVGPSSRSFQ